MGNIFSSHLWTSLWGMRRQYGEIRVTWVVCSKIAEHCGSLSVTGVGWRGGAEVSLIHTRIKRKSLVRREGGGGWVRAAWRWLHERKRSSYLSAGCGRGIARYCHNTVFLWSLHVKKDLMFTLDMGGGVQCLFFIFIYCLSTEVQVEQQSFQTRLGLTTELFTWNCLSMLVYQIDVLKMSPNMREILLMHASWTTLIECYT